MTTSQPTDTQTVYQIKVKGHLDQHWSEWFDDLSVTHDEHDDTLLTGPVTDQAALYGLLKKVQDLGIRLNAGLSDTWTGEFSGYHTSGFSAYRVKRGNILWGNDLVHS